MKALVLLVALAGLGWAGWTYRSEIPFLRDAQAPALPSIKFENDKPSAGSSGGTSGGSSGAPAGGGQAAAGGVRRCVVNGKTLYTNEPCPDGSREQTVKTGNVSVVPGYKPPPSADTGKKGIPTARDMLAPQPASRPTLREQMVERYSSQ